MQKLFLVVLVLILAMPFSYALTASIGNARMILRPEVPEGEIVEIDKYILTKNVNDIPVNINLEADDRYKKIIEILDNEFVLQPDEQKKARFKITLKSGGDYEGKINVVFSSADPEIKENMVGLSSTIIILAEGPVNEEYDKVMKDEPETPEEIEEEQQEEVEIVEESQEQEKQETELVVTEKQEPEQQPKTIIPSTNPLIGILVIAIILVLGIGVFFAAKKLLK